MAESISPIFKWVREMVAAQSCVKAVRGRQNRLKISISKYSHVMSVFVNFKRRNEVDISSEGMRLKFQKLE